MTSRTCFTPDVRFSQEGGALSPLNYTNCPKIWAIGLNLTQKTPTGIKTPVRISYVSEFF